jgi:parallel beta-helix repeat protein
VLVTDVSGSGFWLRGSGKCVLQDCVARRCKVDGIFIDATRPCILLRCRAELCLNNGAVFDFPLSVLKRGSDAYADAVTLLLGNPHYTAVRRCAFSRPPSFH